MPASRTKVDSSLSSGAGASDGAKGDSVVENWAVTSGLSVCSLLPADSAGSARGREDDTVVLSCLPTSEVADVTSVEVSGNGVTPFPPAEISVNSRVDVSGDCVE